MDYGLHSFVAHFFYNLKGKVWNFGLWNMDISRTAITSPPAVTNISHE